MKIMFNLWSIIIVKNVPCILFVFILQCPYGRENVPPGQPKKKFNSAFYV